MKIVLKVICALFLLTPALSTMQIQAKDKTLVNLSEISINQDQAKSFFFNIGSRLPKYGLLWAAFFMFKEDPKITGDTIIKDADGKITQTIPFDYVHFACGKTRGEFFKILLAVLVTDGIKQDVKDVREWIYEKFGFAC